jgi:hypothetical protein
VWFEEGDLSHDLHVLCMPGNDLLSRLGSTIGAGAFHGRVRDGIGWGRSAKITRQTKHMHFDLVWFFIAASLITHQFYRTPASPSFGSMQCAADIDK